MSGLGGGRTGERGSTSARGREGEGVAAAYLEAEGWEIVSRNFKAGQGELDIIALKEGILSVVEVKNWRRTGESELETSIGPQKRRRIVETTKIFLARNRQYSSRSVRFDVILVRGGRVERIYQSAFTGEP